MDKPAPLRDHSDALATLSHELRTPLAAIIGFADAMREHAFGPLDAAYRECAESIQGAARHMLAVIERMTDGDPRVSPAMGARRFYAAEAIESALNLFRHRAAAVGVELSADLPSRPIPVFADQTSFGQVLINLLANALTATPGGGRVSVGVRTEGHDVVIEVDDTGPGLRADSAPGLGLSLVRSICVEHGGSFQLAKATERGTLAVVRLPILIEE